MNYGDRIMHQPRISILESFFSLERKKKKGIASEHAHCACLKVCVGGCVRVQKKK